jgi:uncharacterized iron-regulated protein
MRWLGREDCGSAAVQKTVLPGYSGKCANLEPMRHAIPLCLAFVPFGLLGGCAVSPLACAPPARWISPATLRVIPDPVPAAAAGPVVLLGEQHSSEADHRWELATIERLYAANPALVLGFEMFPRSTQRVLDRWVAGQLSEADFLVQTDWKHVWGFPPRLYLPIFRFARDHHIPMIALNVSGKLVHLAAKDGFANIPLADREGIGTPAPPSAAYRAELAEAMSGHGGPKMTPERLSHFIDAQLVWDRAMAEAIAAQRAREPGKPVVALMGAGHLEDRYGVPHQLESLDVKGALVFLPVPLACPPADANLADAVFTD